MDGFFRHVFNAGVNGAAGRPDPRVKPEDDGVRKVLKTPSSSAKRGRPNKLDLK